MRVPLLVGGIATVPCWALVFVGVFFTLEGPVWGRTVLKSSFMVVFAFVTRTLQHLPEPVSLSLESK